MLNHKLVIFSATILLSGCISLAPDYQSPNLPIPQTFSLSLNTLIEQTVTPDSGWHTFFTNTQLKQIISIALNNNRDLQTTILKVEEAAQQYQMTDADFYPQLNTITDTTYAGGLTSKTSTTHHYSIGMDISYELDFFGELKNMSESKRQNFMSSQQAQRAAYILVVSQVSQNYLNHVLINQQLNIAKRALKNYQQSFEFIQQRYFLGKSTLLEVEQARSLIETTHIDIAKREGDLALLENALELLVGKYSLSKISISQIDEHAVGVELPKNLSSTILLQRPDIAEAEHQLLASNADIGAARAAFFPSISLTGALNDTNSDLSRLFNTASGAWNFMPRIELPIFNGGRNQSNLSLADVRKKIAIVNYEKKIQTAFKEVADSLSLRTSLQQQILAQQRYLTSLDTTSQLANTLYVNGATSYLDVLDTERSLFTAQQDLIELKYNLQVNEIRLFIALGGGWTE